MTEREEQRGQEVHGLQTNIRGDVKGPVLSGNFFDSVSVTQQYFTGDYERLQDAYIDPRPIFERVNLEHFVGREWLLAEVDDFLHNYDRGYFILEAEAGLGKTTFLAWLVKQRGYIHHFIDLAPGAEGVARGLKNLAAQLISKYDLKGDCGNLLPSSAASPDYLLDLLNKASEKIEDDQRIVLVIDSLEKSVQYENQNVMGLPARLPKGVLIVASQRPEDVHLRAATTYDPVVKRIDVKGAHNLRDMQEFIEKIVTRPKVEQLLVKSGFDSEEFIEVLSDRCNGLWIYLDFVLKEILTGKRQPNEVKSLPGDLRRYYIDYWHRLRNHQHNLDITWGDNILPVMGTLAAVHQPIPFDLLCLFADTKHPSLRHFLSSCPFIAAKKDRYFPYHASVREFLAGSFGNQVSQSANKSLADELRQSTQLAHNRIVDYYFRKWGGFDAKLVHLFDAEDLESEDKYGIRYIAEHLIESERDSDLHKLLRLQDSYGDVQSKSDSWIDGLQNLRMLFNRNRANNIWYRVREVDIEGYLADISSARRQVANNPEEIGLQIRYSLISSSLHSQLENLSPDLLYGLVKYDLLSPQQGLAYARQATGLNSLLHLASMVRFFPDSDRYSILDEVWEKSERIGRYERKAQIIFRLNLSLNKNDVSLDPIGSKLALDAKSIRREEATREIKNVVKNLVLSDRYWSALCVIQSLSDKSLQMKTLLSIADFLPMLVLLDAWEYVLQEDIEAQAKLNFTLHLLSPLAQSDNLAHIAEEVRLDFDRKRGASEYRIPSELMDNILSSITSRPLKEQLVGKVMLFPYMSVSIRGRTLSKVLEALNRVDSPNFHKKILTKLLPYMSRNRREKVLREFWSQSRKIGDGDLKDLTLKAMYRRLRGNGFLLSAFQVARRIARKINNTEVESLAVDLAEDGYEDEALECTEWCSVDDNPLILSRVVTALPTDERNHWNIVKQITKNFSKEFLVKGLISLIASLFVKSKFFSKNDDKPDNDAEDSSNWLSSAVNETIASVLTFLFFSLMFGPVIKLAKILFKPIWARLSPYIFSFFSRFSLLSGLPDVQARILIFMIRYLNSSEVDESLKRIGDIVGDISDEKEQIEMRRNLVHQAVKMKHLVFALEQMEKVNNNYEWLSLLKDFPVSESDEICETIREELPDRSRAYLRVIQTSEDFDDQIRYTNWLAPILAKFDPKLAYDELWNELSNEIPGLSRRESLRVLRVMTPVIASSGGAQAVDETVQAIEDVFRWWP